MNSLYGSVNGQIKHYCGVYCICDKEDGYKPKFVYEKKEWNTGAQTWLKYQEVKTKCRIQLAYNEGKKQLIIDGKRMKVDGYCKESNTVFKYNGCLWHSHPENQCLEGGYSRNKVHPIISGKTHSEIYEDTMRRLKVLKTCCSKLMVSWECEWGKELQLKPALKDYLMQEALSGYYFSKNRKN